MARVSSSLSSKSPRRHEIISRRADKREWSSFVTRPKKKSEKKTLLKESDTFNRRRFNRFRFLESCMRFSLSIRSEPTNFRMMKPKSIWFCDSGSWIFDWKCDRQYGVWFSFFFYLFLSAKQKANRRWKSLSLLSKANQIHFPSRIRADQHPPKKKKSSQKTVPGSDKKRAKKKSLIFFFYFPHIYPEKKRFCSSIEERAISFFFLAVRALLSLSLSLSLSFSRWNTIHH